jgi:glutamyl-tRNA reductase
MLDKYKIITVTHKRINLKEIGQFVVQTVDNQPLRNRLHELKTQFGFEELLYLPTCNRVMYFFVSDTPLDEDFAARFLMAANPHLSNDLLNRIGTLAYLLEGMDALEHLYNVAGSIDSLVVGEHQILGQLREAYEKSLDWGLTGDNIRLVIQNAILAAKGVYSNTRIGDKPVSVVSLAVQQMLRSQIAKDDRVLIVGAGQTNQLVGKFLAKYEFSNVKVFNRTLTKAQDLAERVGGAAHPLEELSNYKEGFDCLIVCTGATEPIISGAVYGKLLQGESGRKVVIDLSIPHNIAPDIARQFDVQYIEIESLRLLAKENLAFREQEVSRARQVLNEYLREFPTLFKQRQLEIALRHLPNEIKAVKSTALNDVFRKEIDTLDEHTRQLIERMLSYMEKKCIGIPMKAAREAIFK